MDLYELAVGVITALLIERRLRRSGTNDRIRALAKDCADTAGCNDDCIGGEGADFHGTQIHRTDATACAVRIEHGGKEFPGLVLRDFAFGFVTPHLLIERVKKVLTCGGSSKWRAMIAGSGN